MSNYWCLTIHPRTHVQGVDKKLQILSLNQCKILFSISLAILVYKDECDKLVLKCKYHFLVKP